MADREWLPQDSVRRHIVQRSRRAAVEARAEDGTQVGARRLLRLQRDFGNQAVGRVVTLARKGQGEAQVQPEVEQAIQAARGGGQALDRNVRGQMEPAMGADFSNVRVHADAQSDALNRSLSARAFTTGQDIFFKQGEYNPGSSGGQELLGHELTHVVQQNEGVRRAPATPMPGQEMEEEKDQTTTQMKRETGIQAKLTVGAPDDQYEQEADRTANHAMRSIQEAAQRQPEPDDEKKKKEMVQGKLETGRVARQTEEDTEE